MNKRDLSERGIFTKYITPAMKRAGWDDVTLMHGNQHLQWQMHIGDASVLDLLWRDLRA